MNVTLRQLRAFVALAKKGSFTEAASSLHVTQSALSGLIKELEDTMGQQVVHRSTRKVQVSDAGLAFLPLAERILQDLDEALHTMADLKDLKTGTVRVAVTQLMACTLMPEVISAFGKRHPHIKVKLSDCVVENVLQRIQSGEVDFAVGPERTGAHGIAAQELFDIPFVAVFPHGHPLSRYKQVRWADFVRYPVISLQGEYTRMLSADVQAEAGVGLLQPDQEVAFMTTALSLVSAGMGVTTCLPYAATMLKFYKLDTRPLRAPRVSRKFHVLTRKDREMSPSARAFADFLRGYLARWSGAV